MASSFDLLNQRLGPALECARRVAELGQAVLDEREPLNAWLDEIQVLYRDLPHNISQAKESIQGDKLIAKDLQYALDCVNDDVKKLMEWLIPTRQKLQELLDATKSPSDPNAATNYGQTSKKAFREYQRKKIAVSNSCNRADSSARKLCAAIDTAEQVKTTTKTTEAMNPDEILKRLREQADQEKREEQDLEAKRLYRAELLNLWNSVRNHRGSDFNTLIDKIHVLVVMLQERGLIERLYSLPLGLGDHGGIEPGAYNLAVAIFRESLNNKKESLRLLNECSKLGGAVCLRMNEWIRRDLMEHIEGRWAIAHSVVEFGDDVRATETEDSGQKDTMSDAKKKKRIRKLKNLGELLALKKAIAKGARKDQTKEESALEFTNGDEKKAHALLRSLRRNRNHPGLA